LRVNGTFLLSFASSRIRLSEFQQSAREPLMNVSEAAKPKAKISEKRSLWLINEHFERIFNAVTATQVIDQRFTERASGRQSTHVGIGVWAFPPDIRHPSRRG